ncbi:MAG: Zn-ribbon domain-containing OB-fold protein, partial [Candidatus Bathyarchaeota archaeon]|nr:Zn-ribbon domain-containing OB-fold protein [Candidatus Bathyarchaeota archaeon]
PLTIEGRWDIPYRHTAGRAASRFFRELKENKRVMGVRCPSCRRVLVPPRGFCERCFVPIDEWVEVQDSGTLSTFTIVYAKFTSLPPPPYCVGLIKLDGADTALMHYVGGVDLQDLEAAKKALSVGMRLEAVWREEREGKISDIEYFRPA